MLSRQRDRLAAATAPRSPWGWAAGGAAMGLLLAAILAAPAQWLAGAVERATGGQVQLADARGTVWNGSARLLLTGGAGSQDAAALPGRLAWTLRPAASGARLELLAPCCTPTPLSVRVQPRWGGGALALADGTPSQWPATLLAGLGTPWNTLQIEGELQLATQGLSVEWSERRWRLAGRAELTALRVSSRLSTLRPMGSYRMTLAGGEAPTLQVATLEGSLQLAGTGQWQGTRFRFNGEATAAPEREAALANLLNIIGRRNGARSIITLG